jgi:hypothetical protein
MRLEVPLDRTAVPLADTLEELERVAADDLFAAVIGPAEAARHHAPDVASGFDEADGQPFARGRNGRNHTARGAAIHDQVV